MSDRAAVSGGHNDAVVQRERDRALADAATNMTVSAEVTILGTLHAGVSELAMIVDPGVTDVGIVVLSQPCDATFLAPVEYLMGVEPYAVTSADLDGDGDQDLVTTNTVLNNISVRMNNGDGTFGVEVEYDTQFFPWSVEA